MPADPQPLPPIPIDCPLCGLVLMDSKLHALRVCPFGHCYDTKTGRLKVWPWHAPGMSLANLYARHSLLN